MPKKGYKQTEEHKRNTGKSQLGRIRTNEEKEAIRKRMKGNTNGSGKRSKEYCEKARIFATGRHWKVKDTSNISKALILSWRNGRQRGMTGKKTSAKTKELQSKSQIRYMQEHHSFQNTSIEIKIQNELKKRNIIYNAQKALLNKYLVDLFINPNIVIECDGDYWHNRPGAQEKDKLRDKNLKAAGYTVYRFWEHEINESAEKCVNQIVY